MAGSGKPVKTNATNSKKRRVVSAATVDGDVPVESTTVTEPSSAPPVAADPAAAVAGPSTESSESSDTKPKQLDVTTIISQLKDEAAACIAAMKLVAAKVRELEKAHNKEKRAKGSRKRKAPESETATVEPKPEKLFDIQEPLREFLGTPTGVKVGKKAARKAISDYITAHNLQDTENRTLIKPDEKLANLFGPPRFVTTKGNHGYSNLNALRYIQDYFIKPEVETQGTSGEEEEVVASA